jgi:flagellar biosynthesis protein FlhB
MVMALVRLLWNQLRHIAKDVPEIAIELVDFLSKTLKMTLPEIKDEFTKKKGDPEKSDGIIENKILKKMRFAYPDYISVLAHHMDLIDMLRAIGMDEPECDHVRISNSELCNH